MLSSTTTPNPSATDLVRGCLPCKKYLLRYVIWRERLPDATTPIPVPGLGPIAAVIDIVRITDAAYLSAKPRSLVEAYDARLYYAVKSDDPRRFVDDEGSAQFNRFLDQLLRDDLNARIIEGKATGEQEKTIIERFLHETGLDEFLDFESVKKAQWRLRVHRRVPLIRAGSLSSARPELRTGARVQRAFAAGCVHW